MGKYEDIQSAGLQTPTNISECYMKYIHHMLKHWSSYLKCMFVHLFVGCPWTVKTSIWISESCSIFITVNNAHGSIMVAMIRNMCQFVKQKGQRNTTKINITFIFKIIRYVLIIYIYADVNVASSLTWVSAFILQCRLSASTWEWMWPVCRSGH